MAIVVLLAYLSRLNIPFPIQPFLSLKPYMGHADIGDYFLGELILKFVSLRKIEILPGKALKQNAES